MRRAVWVGMNRKEVFGLLRSGNFTSIGCYPLFLSTADGGTIHPSCGRENALLVGRAERNGDKQWQVVAADANWEDPNMYCDHCGERIESAYAEEETES